MAEGQSAVERLLAQGGGEESSPIKELFNVDATLKMKSEVPAGLITKLAGAYTIAEITGSKVLFTFCFPAGAKVLVKNTKFLGKQGTSEVITKNIEEIKKGDLVLSFNEKTAQKEFKKVNSTGNRKTDKLYKIKLSNGNEFSATPEHPIAVIDKKGKLNWVVVQDLKLGLELIQYKYKGLEIRCRQLGKTKEELYGKDKSEEIIKNISKGMKKDWEINKFIRTAATSQNIKKYMESITGKNYDEIYGEDKSQEVRDKQSRTRVEFLDNPEGKEHMRQIAKDSWIDKEIADRRLESIRLANLTPETIQRKSEATKLSWLDDETRNSRSEGIKNAWENNRENWMNTFLSNEYKELRSNIMTELWENEEYRSSQIAKSILKWTKEDYRKSMEPILEMLHSDPRIANIKSEKAKLRFLDEEWAAYWGKCVTRKKNRSEIRLENILNKYFPGEWKYVGDRSLWINGRNPDFININGKKKIIESLGCFWHNCKLCNKGTIELQNQELIDEEKRCIIFAKDGYETLYTWDHDPEKVVVERVKNFMYNPNTELITIKNIEEINKSCEVYNIEVEDNNNYFVYGILNHNCNNILMLQISKDRKGRIELMESIVARIRRESDED